MKKKLDSRFPAARIKKIMQADEDVGKMALPVPLLVSKALELFLQALCDRTYDITLKKGAKTVNSLHLKQCVQSFNVFDFLRDTVNKVPDLGGSDAAVAEDRSATKRRKITENEDGHDKDEPNKIDMHETGHAISSGVIRGRGRGRGRGRVRGRGTRTLQRDLVKCENFEDDPDISDKDGENENERLGKTNNLVGAVDSRTTTGENNADKPVIKFDLNAELDEKDDSTLTDSSKKPSSDKKHEDIPGWSLDDVARLDIDTVQLANLNNGANEEEEDYDEEG